MIEKLAYNRTTFIKNAFSIILLLLILVVEGCFNFVTFEFKTERLLSLGFWTNIGFKVVLLVLVKMWVMSMFIDIARKRNVDLNFNKQVNEKLMQTKDDKFAKWVENVENKEIKIEFYKRKINKLIAKLEHTATSRDRMLYFNDNEELKKDNEYCIKRAELEYLISDDYIEKNYYWLDVDKFPQIDSAIFDCPIGNDNVSKKYQLSAKTKTAIFTSLLTASIMTICMQTLWNSIEMFRSDLDWLIIISGLLMDFIFIVWQGLTGISSAFSIIEQQEVLPYVNRNRILEKYLYYKNQDNEKTVREYINNMKDEIRNGKKQEQISS
jgi:hypothetical protein